MINRLKFYSVKEIIDQKLLPVGRKNIYEAIKSKKLGASVIGEGPGRRYMVRGINLIIYIEKLEKGE